MPTRLLDWSNNPLSALYFAVASNLDKDAKLYLMDAYELSQSQNEAKMAKFQGIATSTNMKFQDCIKTIFEWKRKDHFPKFIIPVRPPYFDKRIVLQRGCFTFHTPDHSVLREEHNRTLKSYLIPWSAKDSILRNISTLGIDEFSIYGNLDGYYGQSLPAFQE